MKNPLGFAIAVLATASLALAAGGEGEGKKKKGASKLEKLAKKTEAAPQGGSWSGGPGQGITYADGDNFSVTLRNFLQFNYTYRNNEGVAGVGAADKDVNTFNVRRARTSLSGHLYRKELTYKFQTDWANDTDPTGASNVIKDAWFNCQLMSGEYNLGVRAGQQKTGFGREHSASADSLDFVDRSIVTQVLSNARSRGVQLHGEAMEDRLSWSVGIFNADVAGASTAAGEDSANDDDEPNYHLGIGWSSHPGKVGGSAPLGDLNRSEEFMWAAGAAIAVGNQQSLLPVGDVEAISINVHGEAKINGIAVLGEWFTRSDDPDVGGEVDSNGFQIGATYAMPAADDSNDQWMFGVRFSWFEIDDPTILLVPLIAVSPTGEGEATDIELVVGFHDEGHNLKHQLGLIFRNTDPQGGSETDDFILTIQSTLVF